MLGTLVYIGQFPVLYTKMYVRLCSGKLTGSGYSGYHGSLWNPNQQLSHVGNPSG
jgi:hypothetical protein